MSAPRLLVIDHDPSVQRAVETTLGAEGCEVTAVGDGLTALDVALATTPDLILADYRMEGTNIFRFLEKLKQKNVLKNVALLLLVNPGDVYDELTLRLVGVTDFLRKPLNPKEMIDRVKRHNPIPAPVPAAPMASSAAAATQPVPPKIEDLLGWSQDAASPFSELSQDRAGGFDFNLPVADTSSGALDATQFLDRNELTPTDHPTTINEDAFSGLPDRPLAPEATVADSFASPLVARSIEPSAPAPPVPASLITESERSGASLPSPQAIEGAAKEIARNVVEKVAWDVVPGLAKQSLERVVNEVVERIVWDVVPSIAEAAIKKEIERLTRDNG